MHICFICHEYPVLRTPHGGIGSIVKVVAENLVRQNIQVSVVGISTGSRDQQLTENGVQIHLIHHSNWFAMKFSDNSRRLNATLNTIHASSKIDIIETQEDGFAFVKKNLEIRYVIRLNGGHHFFAKAERRSTNLFKSIKERRSFQKADYYIAVSQYVLDQSRTFMDIDPAKTQVIFNFADTAKFNEGDPALVTRNRLLFVGALKEKKGIVELIKAFPVIKRRFPDSTLYLAGDGKADFVTYLEHIVDARILNAIYFLGRVDHTAIPQLISKSEVCIYPSYMEAMPLAWLEAMSAGRPVVASKTGPGPEIITDGVTGLLCDPYSPKDIADKVITLLADKPKAALMGKAARDEVMNRFGVERRIQENIDFYKRILAG